MNTGYFAQSLEIWIDGGCVFMDKRITALKVQKRDPSRINVYLDGEFAFGLSRIVAAWLTVGKSLDEDKINSLLQEDEKEKAYQRALKFLEFRHRSETEVVLKLKSVGYDEVLIEKVIQRLKQNHLLGDELFARNWVENRSSFRPRSHRMLRMELRLKGVDETIIEDALVNTLEDEELAAKLAYKYVTRLKNCDYLTFQKKLGGYLQRKGFDYSVIKEIVTQTWSEINAAGDITINLINEEKEND